MDIIIHGGPGSGRYPKGSGKKQKNSRNQSKESKKLTGLNEFNRNIRKARKLGIIDRQTIIARPDSLFLDRKSFKYKMQEKKVIILLIINTI